MSTADLSKKPAEVAAMFDDVAEGYDRTNAFLSGGNSALWRIVTVRQLAPAPGMRILDLAAGTGTSSVPLARAGAEVVAADFSPGMLAVGRRKHAALTNLSFVEADATALPFDDNSFDAVTISFGLRNVVEPKKALAEMFRVTKPGGRIVITEFSTPPNPLMRLVYRTYLTRVMPVLSIATSTNSAAYTYLADSIEAWPTQQELAKHIHAVGFRKVAYRNLTGGIVALHRGTKPSA
jgi:demethylmenaquinone methyltransferase/2-methoxy-6-polyprenyl-1,4-benzoquinol methylase